jgi:DNA-binding transcriptional ArsR family regulator
MEFSIEQIRKIAKALSNQKKVEVLNLCGIEKYNLTDIRKKVGYTIQTISNYVKDLEKANLVEKEELITSTGKNIVVKSLYSVDKNGFLKKIN